MLNCPKPTHQLYKFYSDENLYVVDLDIRQVLEIDPLISDVLDRCSHCTNEEILEQLGSKYATQDIVGALEILEIQAQQGILFSPEDTPPNVSLGQRRLRIFVPMSIPFPSDITYAASGAIVGFHSTLTALSRHADLYLLSEEEKVADGIYGASLSEQDWNALPRYLRRERYDGIFLCQPNSYHLYRFLRESPVPVVVRCHTLRGRGGQFVNLMLFFYSLMRDFDAFMCPSDFIRRFYSQLLFDVDRFQVIPNGVDTDMFHPMDKQQAKTRVARLLGIPQIEDQKIVGFFSRFQLEKGGAVFVKLAKLNPEVLFLVVAPTTELCATINFPPNLIYAGQPPREQLPLFINAFDLYCLPSMVGEETFGNAVLEALSCGVPPVLPRFAAFAELIGDGGLIVDAESYPQEIGSFAGYAPPEQLSKGIIELLYDDEKRIDLSKRARKRALEYSWDLQSQRLIQLFLKLKQKQEITGQSSYPVRFAPHYNFAQQKLDLRAFLVNMTAEEMEYQLMEPAYPQSVIEGIGLSLLKTYTPHEIEAVLKHLCKDTEVAREILSRLRGFMNAIG